MSDQSENFVKSFLKSRLPKRRFQIELERFRVFFDRDILIRSSGIRRPVQTTDEFERRVVDVLKKRRQISLKKEIPENDWLTGQNEQIQKQTKRREDLRALQAQPQETGDKT